MTYVIVWRANGDITHRVVEAETAEAAYEAFKASKPPGGVPTKGILGVDGTSPVTTVTNSEGRCLVVMTRLG
jgi:hypothetical protein